MKRNMENDTDNEIFSYKNKKKIILYDKYDVSSSDEESDSDKSASSDDLFEFGKKKHDVKDKEEIEKQEKKSFDRLNL